MHAPALGSAAATLAVSLIYFLWPPAPDTQMRAARASIQEGGSGSPVQLRVPPRAASDRFFLELDCTARCEIPRGRATVHWMEYLEFRRVAGAGAQSGQRIER
jgi:hypothetical protein